MIEVVSTAERTDVVIIGGETHVIEVGIQGPPGPKGNRGPIGPAGGETFIFTQATPLAVWTVPHNLDRYPSVIVTDHLGSVVIPSIEYIDADTIRVTHAAPMTGVAYCN